MGILKKIYRRLCQLLLLVTVMRVAAFSQGLDEYEVKAAFLFNFTRYVEWPLIEAQRVFNICIVGDDPFGPVIDRLTRGKAAYGRVIRILRLKDAADVEQCQIAFVPSHHSQAAKMIEAAEGAILTVGETEDFVRKGGMVYLATEDSRVSIVINQTATETSGLKVSATLLGLAKIFKEDDRTGR